MWVRVSAHWRLWEAPSHLENEGVEFSDALLVLTNHQAQPQAESLVWVELCPLKRYVLKFQPQHLCTGPYLETALPQIKLVKMKSY